MSVVAACSLINGILMGADCRVTFRQPGREDILVDNCQKLFTVGESSVVGFVGAVPLASSILLSLCEQERRHRTDAVSLHNWFPRLCRFKYRAHADDNQRVTFLVGSTIPGHGNIVERQAVVDLANYMFFSPNRKAKTLFYDASIIALLNTPPHVKYIGIPVPRNLLYRLDSPDFMPRRLMPLRFVAVGSGERLMEKIAGVREMIFAAFTGNYHMESFWFANAMESYMQSVDEKTVGGLFPMAKLEYGRVMRLGQCSEGYFPGGYHIRLEPTDDGSWIQRNVVTGKEIPLVPPWEINPPARNMTFDDFRYGMFG